MSTSRQSHRAYNAPLSPSTLTSPLAADQDTSLSASSKAALASLERFNDYVQKHYDQFVANESLERSRLAASFAEKEQSYEERITTLKSIHTNIASLLVREQATNIELRQKLDIATSSVTRLCQVVADANFVFADRKRAPHEIKQEENSQESTNTSDIVICPNAAISSLLSQIQTVVTEMNVQNGAGLPSSVDPSPCHSIIEALGKVVDSLLATQRTFALLQDDFKSVDKNRADTERQNESLQENIASLQEELKRTRSDNERISHELAAARLERENHICRPPASAYPTPAAQGGFPVSLPSPPLEKRDLPIPDDILQDTCNISRKTNQTLPKRVLSENTPLSPQAPVVEAVNLFAPTSTSCERRRIPFNDAVKRVQANPTSSTAQSGPLKHPIVRDNSRTVGPSMLPPPAPVQGIKRTSSGIHKCQNVSKGPPPSLSTSASATSSISEKTNNPHPRKKRRINGASGAPAVNQKHKPTNENMWKRANAAHTSTSATVLPSASSSKHTAVQLPKTNASDLKSLKFRKKPQPNERLPTSALATPSNMPRPIATPTKSKRPSIKPLDLAKKSPQERAAIRKSK